MRSELGFLFEQKNFELGPGFKQTVSRSQADDAATNDDDVLLHFFLPP
jgi:hypothetical protein